MRLKQYSYSTVLRTIAFAVLVVIPIQRLHPVSVPPRLIQSHPVLKTRTASHTLSQQLCQRFAERIRDRLLLPGTRLPSVRLCAAQQGVSVSTVVAAYDQLQALGWVEARRNRGFYVRENVREVFFSASNRPPAQQTPARAAIKSIANFHPSEVAFEGRGNHTAAAAMPADGIALIRGMFRQAGHLPQPGMGTFPPDWLANTFMPAAVRKALAGGASQTAALEYGDPMGDMGLRRALSHKLAGLQIEVAPSEIMTTLGATHALDIASRTLLRPGDCVMVEEPGWAVEFARLQALGMRLLPVPRRAEGPDLEVMAQYCERHQPALFICVSVLHNPTGGSLRPDNAYRLLQLAQQHHFTIVEDDTYSHLAPDHATRLCALDGLQRTIYVSGFAKILAPGWRVGFMAAAPELMGRLLDRKLLSTLTTPALFEQAMAFCLAQGQLRRHAERIRARLEQARLRSTRLALAHGCTFAAEPAGLFGWIDTGVDSDALAQQLLDQGYLSAPGSLFHAVRAPSSLMRINFATTQDAAFWQTLARLRAVQKG